ncbi:MAG: tRNA (N(6)-L-threonylcarbamoyladenosine(37)-C(2))-methylthiotransferase MtaB [Gammaproteobacteria bacterium]|nr:tRNA (N(6)-L-threonylcarbamoyladenosine(37)-C(2))-methylthiotransferase MtaB [Gammaproteobacteria bacterium]MYD75748.1 tRNA (N(6)-L-threonylcarbamoyladenosine(37)-C(2))-methylthiotransferase MtaB [Gammaproteobacteria bacterium]MYJ51218.1 tRNA (N(6)-L-threonylcarbamoyladenosine(37)-C(2))-methylthiotransferase MtaB [Gammaproteobacteria bacterium]
MVSVSVDMPVSVPETQPSAAVVTLGCKVNAFESEHIASGLLGRGYRQASPDGPADLYVINTCTVTAEADRQARQLIRRAIRANPDARIVVTGCYAQIDPEACARIPGVDLVVGNSRKLRIPELVESLSEEDDLPRILLPDLETEISLPEQLLEGYEGKTRAFVQIQQGCDQGCTFCIIHTARGPNRSFSPGMIRRQCERLVHNGYGEIVLCGVDIGSYGSDLTDSHCGLSDLISLISTIEGDFRIRLSSIDPAHVTDSLIDLMAADERICRQLHLSMQSGNTLILKRMKRRATREKLYERVRALRERLPDIVLSADILVGFPTESDTHFMETIRAIDELEIAYPHVFSYSPRTGTPASRIPSQLSSETKKQRAKTARDAGALVWRRVARRQLGRIERILVESRDGDSRPGRLSGRMSNYFPVLFEGDAEPGAWQKVRISGIRDSHLEAVAV